ncbi:MAG: M24 family metallopeptidase [Candidatus Moraniibacteriota bacterium]
MNKLLFASSKERDIFYATGMEIPDAFFYLEKDGEKYVFLDKREIGVFEKNKKDKNIKAQPLEPLIEKAKKEKSEETIVPKVAELIIEEFNLQGKINIPNYFPIEIFNYLSKKGYELKLLNPFFPQRRNKSSKEVEMIESAIRKTHNAFKKVENILKKSKIKKDKIYFQEEVLTSERLKKEVEKELIENNLIDIEGMIVSSGEQGARPHDRGSGEIKPHTSIIVDIFPKDRESGYFADMTRTYLKGSPSSEITDMYKAVEAVQENAIKQIAPGKKSFEVYRECFKVFEEYGFKTEKEGFVTGLGHGLGADVHELPFVNSSSDAVLAEGDVITVEPGLYYSKPGGIRIEDVVVVTKDSCRNLTDYPKNLVIA